MKPSFFLPNPFEFRNQRCLMKVAFCMILLSASLILLPVLAFLLANLSPWKIKRVLGYGPGYSWFMRFCEHNNYSILCPLKVENFLIRWPTVDCLHNILLITAVSGVPRGGGLGCSNPHPHPEILKAFQNRAKLNLIVKTVKNCWI